MKKLILVLTILFLAGCASTRPDITQEQWKLREYKGKSQEQVIAAAREVIRLSDPTDVTFENTFDGFKAIRSSLGYYVVKSNIDTYEYNFIVQEKNGVTRSRLEIDEYQMNQSLLTLGLPVGQIGKPDYPYVYELFYARVDYLLGDKTEWHKCDDAVSRVSAKFGLPHDSRKLGMSSLCGTYADDKLPSSVSKNISLF